MRPSKPPQEKFNSFQILMNLFFSKPYTILFSSTLTLGILFSISSNNWLATWIGLELNLYSFIPLLIQSTINQEKEAAIKYFLVQALASTLLIFGAIILNFSSFSSLLILIALLIKLGAAPCHFWLPPIINSLSWNICWILATAQKIAPIFLISNTLTPKSTTTTSIIASLGAILGAIGGLNQTQIRAILAYSSVSHIGWVIARILSSSLITIIYLISYLIIISRVIKSLSQSFIYSSQSILIQTPNSKSNKTSLIIRILRLRGLPPLFGFFPKMLLLLHLITFNIISLRLILVLCSTLNLYFYLKIICSSFFNTPLQATIKNLKQPNFLLTTTSILRTFLALSFIILLIYALTLFNKP